MQPTPTPRRPLADAATPEWIADVLESTGDAIVVLDAEGRCGYVNPAAEQLLGLSSAVALGQPLWDLLPAALGSTLRERCAGAVAGATLELPGLAAGRWLEVRVCPLRQGLALFFRDISERKRTELLLAGEKRVLQLLAQGATLTEALEELIRTVETQAEGLLASILLLDEDGQRLRHGAAPSLPADYQRSIDGLAIGPTAGSCGTAAYRAEPVVVSDLATDPLWNDYRHLALDHGLRACWSTPILSSKGDVLGTFALYYREPRTPGPDDLQRIELIGRTASIVVERALSEERLRRSQRELTDFVENATEGLHWVGPDGTIAWANQAELDLLGYRREEYVGRNIREFYVDEGAVDEILRCLRDGEELRGYEARLRAKDGTIKYVLINSSVYREAGRFVHARCFTRDITDRKRAELELLEKARSLERQHRLVQTLTHNASAGLFMVDAEGRCTFMNPAAEQLTGYQFAEVEGRDFHDVFHHSRPDGSLLPRSDCLLHRALVGNQPLRHHEDMLVRWDGSLIPVQCLASPIVEGGVLLGAVVEVRDLTPEKRAERALREHQERLEAALSASATGTFRWDVRTDSLDWDDNLKRLFGLPAEAEVTCLTDLTSRIHPDDRETVLASLARCRQEGADLDLEFRVLWPDGSVRWLLDKGRILRDANGMPLSMIGACTDVTERRQSEAALRYQSQLNKTITDNADSCLFMMDERGHPTFMNPAAEAVTGYRLEEIRDRPLHYAIHHRRPDGSFYPIDECPIDQASTRLTPVRQGQELFLRKDGSLFPVSFSLAPLEREGRTVGAVLEFRDVTAQRLAEQERERLYEAERRARAAAEEAVHARDEFLSIASHELRNPVAGIRGAAQLLRRTVTGAAPDRERVERYTRIIDQTSARLAALLEDLLDVSRLQSGQLVLRCQPTDLGALVRDAVAQQQTRVERHRFRLDLRDDCVLELDPDRIDQVIANLLENAVKYSPDGGDLLVSLRPDSDGALVQVVDPGIGLPPGTAERIFEPFGRAPNAAERNIPGLGLGLYICRQIAEQHGGRLWAESRGVGRGTTLSLWLPGERPPEVD